MVKEKIRKVYTDPNILGKIITIDGNKMSLKDFLHMIGEVTNNSKN